MIKNKNGMKRKVPILRISIQNGASYKQLGEIPEVQNLVMETVISAVSEGVKKNKKSITLFEIADSEFTIELEKEKWVHSLEKAIEYYAGKEKYETCACARDLINKLK
jgi:hypothetical protein